MANFVSGVELVISNLRNIEAQIIGGKGGRNTPIARALNAAGGVIRDDAARRAATLNAKQWWDSRFPKAWQQRWWSSQAVFLSSSYNEGIRGKTLNFRMKYRQKASGSLFSSQKRPTGILKNAMRVKMSRLSTDTVRVARVYVQYSRQWDKWDRRNAWFGKFVEYGTGPSQVQKKGRHFIKKASQAKPYFKPAVHAKQNEALAKMNQKLSEAISSYRSL